MAMEVVVIHCYYCELYDWGTNWGIFVGDIITQCPRCDKEDIEIWTEVHE